MNNAQLVIDEVKKAVKGKMIVSSRHLLPFWQVDIYCLRMCREWERLRLQ